jgi:hypothetical protein
MSVQYVRRGSADRTEHAGKAGEIADTDVTRNWDAAHAQRQAWRQRGEGSFGRGAAGRAVGYQADRVASVHLPMGEIADVTEQSANRSPNQVKNTKIAGAWGVHRRSKSGSAEGAQ